jgi:Molybdopterin-guanine dinucleotide biosynthesis protein A
MNTLLPILPEAVTGILMTGGKSSRMGVPKVNLSIGRQTFGHKTLMLMQQFCSTILISQNVPLVQSNYRSVNDIYDSIGPIGGIHACLKASQTPWNLVVACDMPMLTIETIRPLIENADTHPVACYSDNGFGEPLCALYHEDILPEIEKAISEGNYSLQQLLKRLNTCYLPINDKIRMQLANINTPNEYHKLIR